MNGYFLISSVWCYFILDNKFVLVISENVMKADALATALNVMGLEKGLEFSNYHKIKTVYVVKENDKFILKTSKWF